MIELKENNNSYLNDEKIEFRKYQKVIAEKCVNRNSLVVLSTGLGTILGLTASPRASKKKLPNCAKTFTYQSIMSM